MIQSFMIFLQKLKHTGLIGAHRGACSIAPENTMRAIKESVGRCDFIEIDVGLSKDGVAIVIHDDTLNRTTNAKEVFKNTNSYKVSDFTFDELSSLDYGSWFDGKFEPLLILKDTLNFVKENKLFINIEIKDIHKSFSDEKVVNTVLSEINSLNVETQVLVSSFRHEYLNVSKSIEPNIPTAALIYNKHPRNLITYLKELKVDGCHINNELANKKLIDKLVKFGFFVNVYTVDNLVRKKELFNIGVNGIFSNILD